MKHIQNPHLYSDSSTPSASVFAETERPCESGRVMPAMGSSVSVRGKPVSSMSFHLAMVSKEGKSLAPSPAQSGKSSPAGGYDLKSMHGDAGLSFRSLGCGSKDEAFFDSHVWFESDCEDDFFSVNGETDFTPSHCSTPDWNGLPVKQQLHEVALFFDGVSDAKSELSPMKTLAELLQDSFPGSSIEDEHKAVDEKVKANGKPEANKAITDQLPNSVNRTPHLSGTNSIYSEQKIPDGYCRNGKKTRGKAIRCCLPSLVHSLSFGDKKTQIPSNGRYSGG